MQSARKLSLKKETLTALSSEELGQVIGASGVSCFFCQPPSDFQECITGLRCITEVNC